MSNEENTQELEPGFGADVSPDDDVEEVEADAEATETDEQEENEADSPPADKDQVDKKPNPVQERIDKLTRNYREAERRAAMVEARNQELERKLQEIPEPTEPQKTLEDFNFDENLYRDYLFTEAERRAERVAERIVRGYERKTSAETLQSKFKEQETAFEKEVTDYREVAYNPELTVNQAMAEEIKASDLGAQMIYFLGKNPDRAAEISKLPERMIIREMALLENQLRTEKSKPAGKKVSGAPPPPAKIDAGTASLRVSTTDPRSDKMSDEDWFKAEEKRKAKYR